MGGWTSSCGCEQRAAMDRALCFPLFVRSSDMALQSSHRLACGNRRGGVATGLRLQSLSDSRLLERRQLHDWSVRLAAKCKLRQIGSQCRRQCETRGGFMAAFLGGVGFPKFEAAWSGATGKGWISQRQTSLALSLHRRKLPTGGEHGNPLSPALRADSKKL